MQGIWNIVFSSRKMSQVIFGHIINNNTRSGNLQITISPLCSHAREMVSLMKREEEEEEVKVRDQITSSKKQRDDKQPASHRAESVGN